MLQTLPLPPPPPSPAKPPVAVAPETPNDNVERKCNFKMFSGSLSFSFFFFILFFFNCSFFLLCCMAVLMSVRFHFFFYLFSEIFSSTEHKQVFTKTKNTKKVFLSKFSFLGFYSGFCSVLCCHQKIYIFVLFLLQNDARNCYHWFSSFLLYHLAACGKRIPCRTVVPFNAVH